jgi:lipoprotein-anchoring transpeptidase ErfK/SrfK
VPVPAKRLALGLGAGALALSACTPVASVDFQTVVPSEQSRATIVAEPSGAKKVDPAQKITVRASEGQLAAVTVTGPKGPLKGQISEDGTVWTANRSNLAFGATYTVQATAVDQRGVPTTRTDQFRTVQPKAFVNASVQPGDGATVGVGMPITVTFDEPIKDKAAVERAMVVYTPTPIEGAWSWTGDTIARFRPKKYWPGNIDVTVALNLKGVKVDKGVFGEKNSQTTFTTADHLVIKVDAQAHEARVIRNGERIRTIPVTTGKAGFETRSGNLIILSKEPTRIMDAATGGTDPSDPEYYRLEVQYAMRITYSGEFLHAAPWSVGSQGFANVSHGCIGMSTSNAQWLFDQVTIGDPVEVTGTDNPQNLGNGVTVWTTTWDEWLADSATGATTTVVGAPGTPAADPNTTTTPDTTVPDAPAGPADGLTGPSAAPTAPGASTAPTAPAQAVGVSQTAFGR